MEDATERLYPDVKEAGSLAALLEAELAIERERAGRPHIGRVRPPRQTSAIIEEGHRTVSVSLAELERLFLVGFRDKGVQVAGLVTPNSVLLCQVILGFLAAEIRLNELARRFPEFELTPEAEPHEAGAEAEVADQWQAIMEVIKMITPELLPLAVDLSTRWPFKHLFPVMSTSILGFSQCTGYPYSRDCPSVYCKAPGCFVVQSFDGRVLGKGDQKRAIELLLSALPPDCGHATQGAAGQLV